MDYALLPFFVFGATTFYLGLVSLAYYPLALAYPFWERRLSARSTGAQAPFVSVLIPAYNEERSVAACIDSVLASCYPHFEVIVINDGSRDGTADVLRPYADAGRIRYIEQANAGKAAALNTGLAAARGEIILFTDADSIFEPDTLENGVSYLADPAVGAVSGNDTVLQPRGWLQKMLVVTSHIGTGFVRRALSMARVLPIIPGNLGLVRTEVLRSIGGFVCVWGEDLELTWRLHRAGVRIVYGARTRVLAECPSTLPALWKQRVRWVRSYLKVLDMHADMVGNPRYGAFGLFLVLNSANMIVVPLLQLLALLYLPFVLYAGAFSLHGWDWLFYSGIGFLLLAAVVSVLLDRNPRDLRYLPYALALVPVSFFYNAIVAFSMWAQLRAHAEDWNKLERRGSAAVVAAHRIWAGVGALALVALAGGGGYWLGQARAPAFAVPAAAATGTGLVPHRGGLAVAIHFDAWRDWRDAYRSILDRPEARYIDRVAVSAGRSDWAYFRWTGNEASWSAEQKSTPTDMLEEATAALAARGYATTAILDALAERYLATHPGTAARDDHGAAAQDVVCSTELAEGDYGDHLVAAAAELARRRYIDTVAVTELFYDRYCYDDRCLVAFRRATGYGDWPRTQSGAIDKTHPAIGAWRSRQVASVVGRIAAVVHAQGKRLAFDVKLSKQGLAGNSVENGQDYRLLAPFVDQLVPWDYFALDGRSPESSAAIAAYFDDEFGTDRFYQSIGLWTKGRSYADAEAMLRSLRAAEAGGATQLWLTPVEFFSDDHWRALAAFAAAKTPPM